MGVRQIYLEYLEKKGVFDFASNRILDIGAQNCYLFTPEYIGAFLRRHGIDNTRHSDFVGSFATGGSILPNGNGFSNDAFLSELFRLAGISYTSIDVFKRPDNIVADLNEYRTPPSMRGSFTTVLNFGTTEHVLDQRNCFEVIHDCAAVDGYIFHQVPAIGCVDHSFFVYSPLFFVQIAEANEYELIDLWFSGPYGANSVYKTMVSGHYGLLKGGREAIRDRSLPDNYVDGWDTTTVPDGTINVMLRKTRDVRFRLPFELSTAVGESALEGGGDATSPEALDLANIPGSVLMEELARRGGR